MKLNCDLNLGKHGNLKLIYYVYICVSVYLLQVQTNLIYYQQCRMAKKERDMK